MSDIPGYDTWKTTPPEDRLPAGTRIGTCDCGCKDDLMAGDDIYELPDNRRILADHWDEFAKEELNAVRKNAEMEEPE